jgi:hypothetical protein
MAIDPSNGTDVSNGYGEKLLIVSTVKDRANIYRDIIADEKQDGTDANDNQRIGTGIFDFTQPCPSTCDENSPLYSPKPKK